ncbi:MAG TPA: ABC transporter permease [Ktedonobacterales bacterium]
MRRYLIRRLLQAVILTLIMSVVFFGLLHAIPGGGPENVFFNYKTPMATRKAMAHKWGLDQPLPVQYLTWLGRTLQGDFGISIDNGQPVSPQIAKRLGITVELFVYAFAFALVVAILLGVFSAVRQYSALDYSVTLFAYAGISIPSFLFGLFLQNIFGVQLHLLPVFGLNSLITKGFSPFQLWQDHMLHLILPVLLLSSLFIATWSRFLRASMLDVIKQDYIRTARAKGLSRAAVFFQHALRNALIPLITQVALDFGGIAGGATITETMFARPGLGSFFFEALELPDYSVLLALLILGAACTIVFNLVGDVLYAVVDPRIRYS